MPAFDPAALTLAARGDDDVVRSLPELTARWADGGTPRAVAPATAHRLVELLTRLSAVRSELASFFGERAGEVSKRSPTLLHLSRRYALLHAGAACCRLLDRAAGLDPFFQRSDWLALVLARLLQPKSGAEATLDDAVTADIVERVAPECLARVDKPRLLSVAAISLAESLTT